MLKICAKCKIEQELENFVRHKGKTDGRGPYCKICARIISREWKSNNLEKAKESSKRSKSKVEYKQKQHAYRVNKRKENLIEFREKGKLYSKQHRKNNLEYWILYSAKARAKRDGIPCDLSVEDIIIPEFCPILGIPLITGTGRMHQNSPSLDRIIPSLGYVKGNVQIISWKANTMKQDASLSDLIILGEWAKLQLIEEESNV